MKIIVRQFAVLAISVISMLGFCSLTYGQSDSISSKINLSADFRFRVEQDWNGRLPDNTYNEDRSRMRYRARLGLKYQHNSMASFGIRLRTGEQSKQQDPQITLGQGEFETVPISFEHLYFNIEGDWYKVWIGKNTFPFEKQNELFWSDNVYPDGVFGGTHWLIEDADWISYLDFNAGHFIMRTNGLSFSQDRYFQGVQMATSLFGGLINMYPGLYYFHEMPNIPDGAETYTMDYSIFHLGMNFNVMEEIPFNYGFDYYNNFQNYSTISEMLDASKDETTGIVAFASYGELKEKKDWKLQFTYAYLQKYSAVDFLAQNDWARWDYSAYGSPDGRLTNMKGFEAVASYNIDKNIKLTTKFYKVKEIRSDLKKETGTRIRFDLDISF